MDLETLRERVVRDIFATLISAVGASIPLEGDLYGPWNLALLFIWLISDSRFVMSPIPQIPLTREIIVGSKGLKTVNEYRVPDFGLRVQTFDDGPMDAPQVVLPLIFELKRLNKVHGNPWEVDAYDEATAIVSGPDISSQVTTQAKFVFKVYPNQKFLTAFLIAGGWWATWVFEEEDTSALPAGAASRVKSSNVGKNTLVVKSELAPLLTEDNMDFHLDFKLAVNESFGRCHKRLEGFLPEEWP